MLLIPGILASKFVPQGDFESIATVVVGSGGAADIEFTSIPSTYQHLQIRGIARGVNNTFADLTFNGDTGNNYAFHDIFGDGSSAGVEQSTSRANIPVTALPNVADIFNGLIIDILDYANTNKYTTTRTLQGRDTNGGGAIFFMSGLWMNTNAITSLKITSRSGNIAQYSHFALYGIKG
jgi:hypothetical protein